MKVQLHVLLFFSAITFALYNSPVVMAQFPCGTQQLTDCNCEGTGMLIADSAPCSFGTAENQLYLLVDENAADVNGDPDDGLVDQVSTSGGFENVTTGDYVMYSLVYALADAATVEAYAAIDADLSGLKALGTETTPGTWESASPMFVLTATPLATVNGDECACPTHQISGVVWLDTNGNGKFDAGEPRPADVTVVLYDSDPALDGKTSAIVGTTTTSANGFYAFDGLADGQYWVGVDPETLPDNNQYFVSPANGANDFEDNDLVIYDESALLGAAGPLTVTDGVFDLANQNTDLAYVNKPSVLAVNLLDFYGMVKTTGNDIYWSTAAELNNETFILERSTDGINYTPIASIAGSGNSNIEKQYQYFDENAPIGISYYRLRSVDTEGNINAMAKVIVLTRQNGNFGLVELFPVPANDIINIAFNNPSQTEVQITIFDVVGKPMATHRASDLGYVKHTFNIAHLPFGMYVVVITNGNETTISKFTKQ